jgi:hypothetical protein
MRQAQWPDSPEFMRGRKSGHHRQSREQVYPRHPDPRHDYKVLRDWIMVVGFVCFGIAGAALIMSALSVTQVIQRGTKADGKQCDDDYECEGAAICVRGKCTARPPAFGGPCDNPVGPFECLNGTYVLPKSGQACQPIGCTDSACVDGTCK